MEERMRQNTIALNSQIQATPHQNQPYSAQQVPPYGNPMPPVLNNQHQTLPYPNNNFIQQQQQQQLPYPNYNQQQHTSYPNYNNSQQQQLPYPNVNNNQPTNPYPVQQVFVPSTNNQGGFLQNQNGQLPYSTTIGAKMAGSPAI
jgi:hypothetical protein